MEKLRIGLIGTGRFGRLHLRVLRQLAHVEVAAIADVYDPALQAAASEFGIRSEDCYGDPLELIKREDLDAVDIVSDEKSHGPLVIAALQYGKHVIVEKPLAVTSEEAHKIHRLQAETNRQVMVGNISRFSQPYYAIKRSIDNGMLGNVAAIRSKRNFSRSWFHSFGNRVHPVYESGVHELDLIVWYAGCRCVKVSAFERNMSGYVHPDLFSAVLVFESGLVASLDSSWMVPSGGPQNLVETLELDGTIDAEIEVIGDKGTAKFGLAHPGFTIWTDSGLQHPETTLWPTGPEGIGGAILMELTHFVNQIVKGQSSPVMPLSHSVHVMEIAEAIVDAARTGEVVKLAGSGIGK
ncbi:Gfo/Idh/MocA family protein [Paenibacillus sp. NPDC057967]|uniref:Gfo/Idh/MocA family protein n=1 Tax=Paenibacillus sp. NPDC057967 TaxID=3346293 RepID=UPI0036DA0265